MVLSNESLVGRSINNHRTFEPRPVVVIEDHFHHISQLTQAIKKKSPAVFDSLTIVCLEKPGPDTTASVIDLLNSYRSLQVAAAIEVDQLDPEQVARVSIIRNNLFHDQQEYCKWIASLIRPEGLLIQDIELETLEFIPREKWWETTFLATTVRGIFGPGNLNCCFFSNKRGYEATFGAELLAAGHDPRDVLNKNEMEQMVVPKISRFLKDQFPWSLNRTVIGQSTIHSARITQSDSERKRIESSLDLVVWPMVNQLTRIGGVALSGEPGISLNGESNEAMTWNELARSAFGLTRVTTAAIGQRIAPAGASKAETTNAAARHIHALRKRLVDSNAIVTVDSQYRLTEGLSLGIVEVI